MMHITQKLSWDCGVACLAMLMSELKRGGPLPDEYEDKRQYYYEKALGIVLKSQSWNSSVEKGICPKALYRIISTNFGKSRKRFSLICGRSITPDRKNKLYHMLPYAVLLIKPKDNEHGHWVIWKGRRKKMYDPTPSVQRRYVRPYMVNAVICEIIDRA